MPLASLQKVALDALYYSGLARVMAPLARGVGCIFMLHHVRPGGGLAGGGFNPNGGLEVTPEFLDQVISLVKSRGYDLVSLEEAGERLRRGGGASRFAVFTSDDGYRDNYDHAWPVFRRHDCPFTVFVAPAIADGTCLMWWRGIEAVIAGQPELHARIGLDDIDEPAGTDAEKMHAFRRLYWPVRRMEEHAQREWIERFCSVHGIDLRAMCRAEAMTWDELREMAADPLCSIGAHTVNHYALAKLDIAEARAEMALSRERIAAELGRMPATFAYPYGDRSAAGEREFALARELGFAVAVTTRKGLIFAQHRDHLTALPRVSLNGGFQHIRYADVLLSGAPFAVASGLRPVRVA